MNQDVDILRAKEISSSLTDAKIGTISSRKNLEIEANTN